MKDEDLELEALYRQLMEEAEANTTTERYDVFEMAEHSENFSEELKRVLSDLKPIRNDKKLTEKYFDKHLRTLPNGEKYDQDPRNDIMETSWLPSFCNELHQLLGNSGNAVTYGYIFNILSMGINQRDKVHYFDMIPLDDIIDQYYKDQQEEQERQSPPTAPPTTPPTEKADGGTEEQPKAEKGAKASITDENAQSLADLFKPSFKGMGRNENYFDGYFLPQLKTSCYTAKDWARLAYLVYNSKQINPNKKPQAFTDFSRDFAELLGLPDNVKRTMAGYKSRDLKGDTAKKIKSLFYYLEEMPQ